MSLLQKYNENKEALMQIGHEAIAETIQLGLPVSDKNMQNIAKAANMTIGFKKLENGNYVSEELLQVKYIGTAPTYSQVRLICEHIHGSEDPNGITDGSFRTYKIFVKDVKYLETNSFSLIMKEFAKI